MLEYKKLTKYDVSRFIIKYTVIATLGFTVGRCVYVPELVCEQKYYGKDTEFSVRGDCRRFEGLERKIEDG